MFQVSKTVTIYVLSFSNLSVTQLRNQLRHRTKLSSNYEVFVTLRYTIVKGFLVTRAGRYSVSLKRPVQPLMAIKELKTRCNRFSDGSFERLLLCSVLSGIRRALHTSTIRPSAIPGSFLLEGFIESLWQLAKRRSRTSDRFCEFPRRIQNESRH